jgi:microcystin-dependent protein
MGTPYLGEIKLFAGTYAPQGWATCDGQTLPISDYSALFSLLGTTYGGDGQTTFNLPDLRGRVPLHLGNGYIQGGLGGTETVSLTAAQLPAHTHTLVATGTPNGKIPTGNVLAKSDGESPYLQSGTPVAMQANAISSTGGSLPHDNLQPFLVITFIIALEGVYPSQN